MSKARELGIETRTFFNGRPSFTAAVLDTMNVPRFFNEAAEAHRSVGRNPQIPYGTLAKLMLINICDDHSPLYKLQEYFADKDLPALAGHSVTLEMIHDDRFGKLLDCMHAWGSRKLFNTVATHALVKYGLSIRSINYDTTSKVMWGAYEGSDGKVGVVSITFGHSKDKRGDKNQLKIGIGTADGVIVDAKVLAGNMDDKTYNNETLDDVNRLLDDHSVNRDSFYYVADSAFFTEKNIKKAMSHKILFVTLAPETTNLVKELIDKVWEHPADFHTIKLRQHSRKGQASDYSVQEFTDVYKGVCCKFAVCYSPTLQIEKQKTADRQIPKELEELEKIAKPYAKKRSFACEPDAQKEIEHLLAKQLKKVKYHTVSFSIIKEEKKRRGRPRKDFTDSETLSIYRLKWDISLDKDALEEDLKRQATFVLATNDTRMNAEQILVEYKTQSSVEKKFQQIKSPKFVNSLYLKKPERIEALVYLILIAMMVLSVVERTVRLEMQEEDAEIIGPGRVRMKQPSLRAIVDLFAYAPVNRETYREKTTRYLVDPLSDSQLRILEYLGISPSVFTGVP